MRASMIVAAAVVLFAGCGIYSFTGASIPGHLQRIAVPLVDDRSVGSPAGIDQRLTDLLIDRFAGRTRLVLVQDEGDADAVLFASIERYGNDPAAVTGQETAALNRVTISVRVHYRDRVEEADRLERTFQQQETYDAANIALEAETADEVLRRLADDIFTAATSDW